MNSRVLSGETQKQRESHSDGALALRAVNTQKGGGAGFQMLRAPA